MYDEFERALTGGRTRRGLSPLGWVGVAVGVVMLAGAVGVGYAVNRAARHARHIVRELGASSGAVTARMLSRLEGTASLVTLDPGAGLSFLRGLPSGDPSQALVTQLVRGDLQASVDASETAKAPREGDAGSLTIHSDDGDVHVGLTRGRNGGSLVVDSKDGHVRFDLTRSSQGGTLTIDSDDGRTRIDLLRGDDGGRLRIRGDEGTVELGIGSNGRSAPAWVPRPKGMPETNRPVFSLSTDEALLGAVMWTDAAAPGELLASFRADLEGDGYLVQAEEGRTGPGRAEASLWARRESDGRMVFLLSRRENGHTAEVLGYGREGR